MMDDRRSIENSEVSKQGNEVVEVKYLKDDAIYFYNVPRKSRGVVPPPTPDYDNTYDREFQKLPDIQIDAITDVPQISNEGIKFSIENLGHIFGCNDYEYDLIQFWFLDILTDCLWKAQDIFQFDLDHQKIILNWVTSIFRLIADPTLNISRKDFLSLFKSIVFNVYHQISKCETFPSPNIIEDFLKDDKNSNDIDEEDEVTDKESASSNENISLSTFTIKSSDKLIINPEFNIKEHIQLLKTHNPLANVFHRCEKFYKSQVDIMNYYTGSCEEEEEEEEEKQDENLNKDYNDSVLHFYKADYATPPRFRSSYLGFRGIIPKCACVYGPGIYCVCVDNYLTSDEYHEDYYDLFKSQNAASYEQLLKPQNESLNTIAEIQSSESAQILNYLMGDETDGLIPPNHSEIDVIPVVSKEEHQNTDEELEKLEEQEILKEWAYFRLMEQRNWDMDDPKVGWVAWLSFLEENKDENVESFGTDESISESTESSQPNTDRALHFNILKAIVDFVFEYFYESFHFTLIKLAFRATPNIITQTINDKYRTPKVIKQEFKRPKPTPKKKEKKEKKDKKAKKEKAKKKSKDKKGSKSSKKSSKKSEGKKGKKGLTKEEKAELERLKHEQALLEEERIKQVENRVFMFPLADAASEHLFMSIFENWVNIAAAGKEKKDKKKK